MKNFYFVIIKFFSPILFSEAVAFKGGKVNVIGTSDQVSAEILGERVDLNIGDELEVEESRGEVGERVSEGD